MEDLVRKIVVYGEDLVREGGREGSMRMFAVAAVLRSPWAGLGFVEDLRPEILRVAPPLAQLLVPRLLDLCGGADAIQAYGKAALVGLDGEVEHASALIHTLRFGNIFREAVGGTAYLSFTNLRGPAAAPVVVPLAHKTDSGIRSHYLTIQFAVPDAPRPDEIVVALAAATGGRPNARIGDRYQDMAEMGIDR